MTYYYESELYHHGIKGQKWGIRRYQNEDGTLTAEGKRRSSQYNRAVNQYNREYERFAPNIYLKAYNKTVDEYNNGKIDEYNKTHNPDDKDYVSAYEEMFNRDLHENLDRYIYTYMSASVLHQKVNKLVDKYMLDQYDEFAKKNKEVYEELRKRFG